MSDTKKWYPGKYAGGGSSKAPKPQEKVAKEVIQKAGYIFKRGSWMKSWKLRYFILRKDIQELQYYENADTTNVILGSISLNSSTVVNKASATDADGFNNAAYIITNTGKGPENKILVRFETAEQLEEWFKEINVIAKTETGAQITNASNEVVIGTHIKEGWTCYGRKFYAKMAGRSAGTTVSSKPVFTDADINRQGYLYKRGTWFKSWKRRFFILRKDIHELHYFEDHLTMRLLGMISLDTNTVVTAMNEEVEESDGYSYVLRISSAADVANKKTNILRFNTLDELEDWSRDIKAEAALVVGQRPSEMSNSVMGGQTLDEYLKGLNQDIRSMKEELSNIAGNVVPSMSSQMNARADNIRQSTIGYETEIQRLQDELRRMNANFKSLGLDLSAGAAGGAAGGDEADRNNLIFEIGQAFTQITEEITGLMVDRRATMVNSNMTTTSFHQCVNGKTLYKYTFGKGPVAVPETALASVPKHAIRSFAMKEDLPAGLPYATITAQWILAESNEADDQNILGGTGKLMVMTDEPEVTIPVVTATEEFLSYYRAHLLQDGDYFHFETTRDYPLFMMDIGENYLKEFIMKKKKGLYLEWHNEPHYHEPINEQTRGCYCLAREVPCDDEDLQDSEIPWKNFHITCFRIPLGTACYSSPYAIHDDAPTIGAWRVGYIDAEDFSTVTIYNCESGLIGFTFDQQ